MVYFLSLSSVFLHWSHASVFRISITCVLTAWYCPAGHCNFPHSLIFLCYSGLMIPFNLFSSSQIFSSHVFTLLFISSNNLKFRCKIFQFLNVPHGSFLWFSYLCWNSPLLYPLYPSFTTDYLICSYFEVFASSNIGDISICVSVESFFSYRLLHHIFLFFPPSGNFLKFVTLRNLLSLFFVSFFF